MRRVRVALAVVFAVVAVGCGSSSSGPKEEKSLPPNRIPKTGEPKK